MPEWLRKYRKGDLGPDLLAGIVVATMLVPQAMAYALLAELPVEVGLYAGLLPVAVYAWLGSSPYLAVGPVAIVSLLVANGIAPLAGGDVDLTVELAITLALMVGVLQIAMGALRAGFLVNFLSHPVLSGFTSAAAIVIGASQLKHLLGITLPRSEHPYEMFASIAERVRHAQADTVAVGLATVGMLVAFPWIARKLLRGLRTKEASVGAWSKGGPLAVVILGVLVAWLAEGALAIPTVGEIPAGLPRIGIPTLRLAFIPDLLPTALVIGLVGFMESFAVAQSLGSKRRQRVDANRELVALGVSNLGSAASGGYPVTGGFSRSAVNFQAGARSGLASWVTAGFMALTLLFLTPLVAYLPKAVLAAIILVAIASLIDFRQLWSLGRYSAAEAACWLATFAGVFLVGVEWGIAVGVVSSIVFFLWRTSRPHVAVVGRIGTSEQYRNITRHDVATETGVLAVRVDESLYFANVRGLEERLISAVAADPSLRHLLLVCSGINYIDATGLDSLRSCHSCLEDAGVTLNLAEVKGPVADQLERAGFLKELGAEHLFPSTFEAMSKLTRDPAIEPK